MQVLWKYSNIYEDDKVVNKSELKELLTNFFKKRMKNNVCPLEFGNPNFNDCPIEEAIMIRITQTVETNISHWISDVIVEEVDNDIIVKGRFYSKNMTEIDLDYIKGYTKDCNIIVFRTVINHCDGKHIKINQIANVDYNKDFFMNAKEELIEVYGIDIDGSPVCLTDLINKYGLDKLNTFTKYPSILTYHEIDNRGMLQDNLTENKGFESEELSVYEKVDGTNVRIIIDRFDCLVGTREELIYAKGDRRIDPSFSIMKTIMDKLTPIRENIKNDDIYIIYGEVYGGKVGDKSKNYSWGNETDFKVFDIVRVERNTMIEILEKNLSAISSWRTNVGHKFLCTEELTQMTKELGLEQAPLLTTVSSLPTEFNETLEWLGNYRNTTVGLDVNGLAEGVVVRNKDRNMIRKIRFEDYENTIRRRNKGKRK